MRILFLSPWNPYPPDNGSKIRIHSIIRGLSEHNEVRLIALTDQESPSNLVDLGPVPAAVNFVARRHYDPRSVLTMLALASRTPRAVRATRVPQMAEWIRKEFRNREFDLVIASQWGTASYADEFDGCPAIFEELELGSFESKVAQANGAMSRLRHRLPLIKMTAYLSRLLPRYIATTVVSENEASLVNQAIPGYNRVEVIPNFVELRQSPSTNRSQSGRDLIFTGSLGYFANHDAMSWFLESIYPQVTKAVPGVMLRITGEHANRPLPASENTVLTGVVADVRPLISASAVSIAPIRLGGGTRFKVLEAMALRTPVVSTSKGVEGLDVVNDEHVLIADEPGGFAAAVVRLLRDPGTRNRLADSAYELVREKYDYAVVMPRFLEIVERAARA